MDAKDKLRLKMLALMPERVCIGCGEDTKSRSGVCVRCWKSEYPTDDELDESQPALVDEDGPVDPRDTDDGDYNDDDEE